MFKLMSLVCCHLTLNTELIQMLNQRLVLLRRRNFTSLHSVRETLITISQQYATTTHVPIESLKTCVTTLCSRVTINTTSTYGNMAV